MTNDKYVVWNQRYPTFCLEKISTRKQRKTPRISIEMPKFRVQAPFGMIITGWGTN